MEGQKLYKMLTSVLKDVNPERPVKVGVIIGDKYMELDVANVRVGYPPGETNEETYLIIVAGT